MLTLPQDSVDLDRDEVQRVLAELDRRMAGLGVSSTSDPEPIVDQVFASIRDQLSPNDAFAGEVAQDFLSVLAKIVKFVASRLNVDRIEDSGLDYLFDAADEDDPLEEDLAQDLRRFLASAELNRGSFMSEVRAIAHGRVDVLMIFPTHRFVAELKKEGADASWDALVNNYGAQGAAYQATDVPLGFVIALDLTRAGQPPPLLAECFEVRHLAFDSEASRTLVFVKVTGKQKSPSAL